MNTVLAPYRYARASSRLPGEIGSRASRLRPGGWRSLRLACDSGQCGRVGIERARIEPPLRNSHHAGLHELEAVEELRGLVGVAELVRDCAGVVVVLLRLAQFWGDAVHAVTHGQEASR